MRKKKLLVDARCVSGEGQGMLTYIKGLYDAFYKNYQEEYELFFAGYDFDKVQASFPFLKKENFILLKSHARLKLFCFEFPQLIKKYQIEYAHFQYMTPFVKNCKFITTTHDVLFLDFPKEFSTWYRLKRKLLFFHSIHKSEVRLTVSNYSRKKLMEHFGVNPDTVAVTPNAVKDIYFRPYDKQQIQKNLKQQYGIEDYILYVSRIERRKNHQLLLDAYAELDLAKSGKQLVLIGNNSLNDAKLTKQIEALKAQYPDKVHWFKYVSDADLLRFYQGADLFVYPSKGEGFGIPPIEAGALGINTLCANNTAMGDFDFFGNQLFDADNLEELKAKLLENEQSKKSPAQLKAISNAIRQYYSWEKSAAILNRAIRQSERSVVGIAEKRKRAA